MSNNIKKILAVALLSTIGLAACNDEVKALPTHDDKTLVALNSTEEEVYHNLISIIEEAYRDGSLATATLDRILYTYSVSVFGRYNRVAQPYNLGESEITLKEAAKQIKVDEDDKVIGPAETHDKVDAFIEGHKAYWTTDNDGNRVEESKRGNTEYARVYAKWRTIEDRIARIFYGNISSAYTNDLGNFSEEKYLRELRSQMYKVLNPYGEGAEKPTMTDFDDKVIVTPDVQEEDVFTEEIESAKGGKTTLLHRENYQDPKSWSLGETETATEGIARYVEDEIIPTIYRDLLVEQYLLDESYNNLGRSAARKVNVLTISNNANNDKAANYLMKYFVRNQIGNPNFKANEITIDRFKDVSNAMKGIIDPSTHKNAYLELVNGTAEYAGAFPYDSTNSYYTGTDYGDMMEKFVKIKDDINTTNSEIESDFTGGYKHTIEVGKEIKENEIKKHDYVTDGWYIKSNGVEDLPEDIKSRLFNIGVSNVLDDASVKDRFDEDFDYSKESKLVAKINGKHYLKIASKQAGADKKDDILFYEGGKYYVVQIEEAVSGSKLAKEATNEKYEPSKKEEIINEVARVIANNDTYRTSSTKHWLEQASIKYHDSTIYDYFKENYPDLFN